MMTIETQGFTLLCEELKADAEQKMFSVKGYEGGGAVLDLSAYTDLGRIDRKAFLSCKSLKRLILPASVEWIDDWAFSKCTNLQKVEIRKVYEKNILGRGAFEGCTALTQMSFLDSEEHLANLLTLTINRMPNELLFRSDDLGEQTWYEKWDIALLSFLKSDEEEEGIKNTVCGEEDISYDPVGMVDGEMPGETPDFVKAVVKNKCFLCFQRLTFDTGLCAQTREILCRYIVDRSFGKKNPAAWITLLEDCSEELSYYQLYLEIVKPSKKELEIMIQNVNATKMQVKAFLINEASKKEEGSSFLEDLLF